MVLFGRFKPEEPATEGLLHRSRDHALQFLEQVLENWEPPHQAWLLNNSHIIAGLAGAIPGVVFTLRFGRILGLQNQRRAKLVTMPVAVITPGISTCVFHKYFVRDDILLNETDCSVCVDVRSSSAQAGIGVGISSMIALVGNYATASSLAFRSAPRSISGVIAATKVVYGKNSHILVAFLVLQLLISGVMVRLQYTSRDEILAELESRWIMDQARQAALAENKS